MKIGGIILIVLGAFFFLSGIGGFYLAGSQGFSEYQPDAGQLGQNISFGIAFVGIGIFLITRANKKKREKEEKEKWDKGIS